MAITDLRKIAELLVQIDAADGHPARGAAPARRRASSSGETGYRTPLHRDSAVYFAESAEEQVG